MSETKPTSARTDFVLELVAVFAGVLLALSLGGVLDWWKTRSLVQQARDTLALEVETNRDALASMLDGLPDRRQKIEVVIQFVDDVLEQGGSDISDLELSFAVPPLASSGFETAERTGALAEMGFDEVRQLATIYSTQELLTERQRRYIDSIAAGSSVFIGLEDPSDVAPDDLALLRREARSLRASIDVDEQIARGLLAFYETYLEGDGPAAP